MTLGFCLHIYSTTICWALAPCQTHGNITRTKTGQRTLFLKDLSYSGDGRNTKQQRWNLKSGGPKNLTCQRDIKAGERPTLADIWGREALTPGLVWEKGRFTGSDARKTMQAAWAASPAPRGSRWGLGRYWRYDSEPLGSVRLGWPAMTNVYKGSTVMSRD